MSIVAGTLYVVATPIGNLGDLSPRAREVLAAVAMIAAEDTRHSRQLLRHFGIDKPCVALHEHNERGQVEQLVERLGKDRFDQAKSDEYFAFLKTWFTNLQRRNGRGMGLDVLAAPRHIHSAELNPYRFNEPLKAVRVYWVEIYADLDQRKVLRRDLVREIPLSQPDDPSGSPKR